MVRMSEFLFAGLGAFADRFRGENEDDWAIVASLVIFFITLAEKIGSDYLYICM